MPTGPIWDRQLVLVTGKGGVGKTALTAALARSAQGAGRRVLAAEVTPDLRTSSPLFDRLGYSANKSDDPVEIEPNLFGVRVAPPTGHRMFLRKALRVGWLVDSAMRSAALTRFLMAAPTFPEVGILFHLVSLIRSRRFDHIIVDLPATGHALALASLPKIVNRVVPRGLIGDAIREGLDCMTDPSRCTAAIATLPESLPVTETFELITALKRYDITVGSAVLNSMPDDPFARSEREALWTDVRQRRTGRPQLLGARELRRLERALAARRLFHASVPPEVGRYEIPILGSSSPQRVATEMVPYLKSPRHTVPPPPGDGPKGQGLGDIAP